MLHRMNADHADNSTLDGRELDETPAPGESDIGPLADDAEI